MSRPKQLGTGLPLLTPLQEAAALERLKDPDASNEEILRRAGYAEMTLNAAKRNRLDARQLARRFQEQQGIRPAEAQRIGLETLSKLALGGEQEATRGASAKALLEYGVGQGGVDERPDLSAAAVMLLHRRRRLALRMIAFSLRSPDRALELGEQLHAVLAEEDAAQLRADLRAEMLGLEAS